jgi:hypothetical protein
LGLRDPALHEEGEPEIGQQHRAPVQPSRRPIVRPSSNSSIARS